MGAWWGLVVGLKAACARRRSGNVVPTGSFFVRRWRNSDSDVSVAGSEKRPVQTRQLQVKW